MPRENKVEQFLRWAEAQPDGWQMCYKDAIKEFGREHDAKIMEENPDTTREELKKNLLFWDVGYAEFRSADNGVQKAMQVHIPEESVQTVDGRTIILQKEKEAGNFVHLHGKLCAADSQQGSLWCLNQPTLPQQTDPIDGLSHPDIIALREEAIEVGAPIEERVLKRVAKKSQEDRTDFIMGMQSGYEVAQKAFVERDRYKDERDEAISQSRQERLAFRNDMNDMRKKMASMEKMFEKMESEPV